MAFSVIWPAILAFSVFLTDVARSQRPRIRYENDRCKIDDPRWICRKLADCQTGQMGIRDGKVPEICSFDELEPIVCCPPGHRENGVNGLVSTSTFVNQNWETITEQSFRPSRTPATSTTRRPSQGHRPSGQGNRPDENERPTGQWNRPSGQGNQWNRPDENERPTEQWNRPDENERPTNQWHRPSETERPTGQWNRPSETERPTNQWNRPDENERPTEQWNRPDENERPTNQWNRPSETTRPTSKPTNRPSATNRPSSRPSKSQQMCEKYAEYVYRLEESPVLIGGDGELDKVDECGRVEEALILGGENAREKEFPHMAQIGYGEKANYWLCGGSLISERFVLSAAHCTEPENRGPALWVRLGEYDTSRNDDGPPTQVIRINQRINHPQYDARKLYNDIALYRLQSAAKLGPYVRPICLHTTNSVPGNKAVATGWGHTSWDDVLKNISGGRGTNILQKVKLNIVDTVSCNQTYRENIGAQLPRGILPTSQLCAGDEQGKDACQGDSGGPLQIPLKKPYCMYSVVGVTSVGRGCGQVPGIYTRVSNFVPWIEKTVWS